MHKILYLIFKKRLFIDCHKYASFLCFHGQKEKKNKYCVVRAEKLHTVKLKKMAVFTDPLNKSLLATSVVNI